MRVGDQRYNRDEICRLHQSALGAEELIYGFVATLVAGPHSVGRKIHATCHWRVVGFTRSRVGGGKRVRRARSGSH
jgi:hypothetical protein